MAICYSENWKFLEYVTLFGLFICLFVSLLVCYHFFLPRSWSQFSSDRHEIFWQVAFWWCLAMISFWLTLSQGHVIDDVITEKNGQFSNAWCSFIIGLSKKTLRVKKFLNCVSNSARYLVFQFDLQRKSSSGVKVDPCQFYHFFSIIFCLEMTKLRIWSSNFTKTLNAILSIADKNFDDLEQNSRSQ